jgi:GxxExxY protein
MNEDIRKVHAKTQRRKDAKGKKTTYMTENELAKIVVDTSLHIHQKLGPGLLESVYEAIVAFELGRQGIDFERQVPVPLVWDGMLMAESFRADIVVEKKLIIELKSVEKLIPVHKKQLLTYLRITGIKLGLLLNFGADLMKNGIERIVNGLEEEEQALFL